jgi:acetyl esterase/lipase
METRRTAGGGASRLFAWVIGLSAVLAAGIWLAFQLSPWPSVLLIRHAFGEGAREASAALEKHVPADLKEWRDLRYDEADPDALLDLYAPANATGPLTTVVWIHGGAFISGDKQDIANYARVLAGQGFAVASVQYSLAPGAKYPKPVQQANRALGWLAAQSGRLPVDPARLVLAGDSAGAQIAAQLAALHSSGEYAGAVGIDPALAPGQLAGALLYCGPFDAALASGEGAFGEFMRTVFWSYFGDRDFPASPAAEEFSVPRHVTARFPPTFISAGNGDPLLEHSRALAEALERVGVQVEVLFFPDDYRPVLGHEYQFDLDSAAGREALERSVSFLSRLGADPPQEEPVFPALESVPVPARPREVESKPTLRQAPAL